LKALLEFLFHKTNLDPKLMQVWVPEIYGMLEYPHTFSKNLFMPVGAPNTWPHLLQAILWLQTLTSIFYLHGSEEDDTNKENEEVKQ